VEQWVAPLIRRCYSAVLAADIPLFFAVIAAVFLGENRKREMDIKDLGVVLEALC
jgi:hypothetical protein